MLPLFDMMLKAHNGSGTEALAKQFGLAQDQAAEAIAALMPAFSSSLKRTTGNPYDLAALMAAMFSGSYGKYFEDIGKAFTDQGKADGNIVLERLFGSKEVSRAVAAQAEQLTGIGQEVFKRMMPVTAGTLMGGLFKQATGQMGDTDIYPMAAISQNWIRMMGFGTTASQSAPGGPDAYSSAFDAPYAKAMRAVWGADELQKLQMPTQPSGPLLDALNSMFDSGLEVHKNYQKNMEAIFDHYLGPAGKG